MKICSKCGEHNEDWMNICQRCGSSIENAEQDDTQVTYEFEKNQYDTLDNSGQQSYGFDDNNNNDSTNNTQNMDLKIILVILLVILGFLIVLSIGKL